MSFINKLNVLSLLSANVGVQYAAFSEFINLASKKSLNAKWSVNSPLKGKGGPKMGTLSGEYKTKR
jgi:hypothetical protein